MRRHAFKPRGVTARKENSSRASRPPLPCADSLRTARTKLESLTFLKLQGLPSNKLPIGARLCGFLICEQALPASLTLARFLK